MNTHCSETTTPLYTTMQRPSNHFSGENTVEELGWLYLDNKWEAEIKIQEAVLHTRTWKGQSIFSLESFISQHRNAYVFMKAFSEHVQY
jgi:hypothetical protein